MVLWKVRLYKLVIFMLREGDTTQEGAELILTHVTRQVVLAQRKTERPLGRVGGISAA